MKKRAKARQREDRESRELVAIVKHPRVSVEGFQLGALTHKLYQAGEQILRQENEPERDCCSSCAFLRGTVPNGCIQTQLDALKAVNEGKPFMCHMVDGHKEVCQGWFAARQARKHMAADGIRFIETDYEFSPSVSYDKELETNSN